MWRIKTFAVAAAVSIGLAQAQGAELKVFVGGAMTETVSKIGADFARTSGHKLEFVSDTTGALINKLKAGEKGRDRGDRGGNRRAAKDGALVQGSRTQLVRALVGVAVKAGSTTAPDLSSVDASSNRCSRPRPCPMSIQRRAARRGHISKGCWRGWDRRADEAQDRVPDARCRRCDAVATGAAELGSFHRRVSPNKGVKIAGPLPNEIQLPTNYVAVSLTSAPIKTQAAPSSRR